MSAAFYYVDGIPTKGLWVDLDNITDTDDILELLAKEELIPRNEDDEPDYDGDLLVADVEGDLAKCFYSSSVDGFDLDDFIEVRDYCDGDEDKEEAVAAFIDYMSSGSFSKDDFESSYCGKWDSEIAYAENLVEELGYLDQMPENLRYYFDYEKFAYDLFISDYYFADGHVFNRNY